MDLDSLLYHYVGTSDLDALDPAALAAGLERMAIDFGVEREPGRRFALWALMHGLGAAPDPITAFKNPRERAAAIAYVQLAGRATAP